MAIISSFVSSPKIGPMTAKESPTVSAVSSIPPASPIASPASRWRLVIVLRCTRAPPIDSIGIDCESSWTTMITAKTPKADGGISRARNTSEENSSSSIAIRE